MKIEQSTTLPTFSKSSLATNSLTQLLTIGGLALGVSVSMPTAPTQAAVLNTGELVFQDGTSNFFEDVNPVAGDTFGVNFNPGSLAFVTGATGAFGSAPYFPVTPLAYTIAPSTGTFTFSGVNAPGTFDYILTGGNLPFSFNNGVNLTVANGSIFRGAFNNAPGSIGVNFGIISSAGSFFSNIDGQVPTTALAFGFGDVPNGTGGSYGVAAAPIPEPFTIIGTIIGGTAAFRMRKKLSNANKN
jgi:hypothetical protein